MQWRPSSTLVKFPCNLFPVTCPLLCYYAANRRRIPMTTALRPMTTGEILDRTFNLYRNNFILFAGIAVLPPALKLILDLIQLPATMQGLSRTTGGILASSGSLDSAPFGGGAFLLFLVYFFGIIV